MSEITTDVTRDVAVTAESMDARAQGFRVVRLRIRNNSEAAVVVETKLEVKNLLTRQVSHLDHLLEPVPGMDSPLLDDPIFLEPKSEVDGVIVFRYMQAERAGLGVYRYPNSPLEYRVFVREFGTNDKYIRSDVITKVVQ